MRRDHDGNTPTLFDLPVNPKVLSRTEDDITSHLAAEHIVETGEHQRQKMWVLRVLREHPSSTAKELASYMGDSEVAHKRLPDLEKDGLVRRHGRRRCRVSGRLALVWEVTSFGKE